MFSVLILFIFSVERPGGKGNKPYVFTLLQNNIVPPILLDVAASSQEELNDWVKKLKDIAVTTEAKVKTQIAVLDCYKHSKINNSAVQYT